MFKYFKKILDKKKVIGFTMIFLSAILMLPISSVNALGQTIYPVFNYPFNDNFIKEDVFNNSYFKYPHIEHYNQLIDYYNNNLKDTYDSYLIYAQTVNWVSGVGNFALPTLLYFNASDVASDFYLTMDGRYSSNTYIYLEFINDVNRLYFNASDVIIGTTNKDFRFQSYVPYTDFSNFSYMIETNVDRPIRLRSNSYNKTIIYKEELYNVNDIILESLFFDQNNKDYFFEKRLYNFQIDLKTEDHLDYTHSFEINYNTYNRPFENLFKDFDFIGLTNDNGLYHWEQTDKCYINNNDYELTSSDKSFKIDITNISGDCLDFYEKVKLIVKLNNATLKFDNNLKINTNSTIHYNFLSNSSVVDILSNFKFVNFTTDKNDVIFDIMVRDVSTDFYDRYFFSYLDKTDLKTDGKYINLFTEHFPLYNEMYFTRDVDLNKYNGFTVFNNEIIDNEIFIFEYKDIYYSFTDNDLNKGVSIITWDGITETVDFDIEFPDPPLENIGNLDSSINSLSKGFDSVNTLYSTFYNNLSTEFQILHNLFFMLLIILVVVKVVLT